MERQHVKCLKEISIKGTGITVLLKVLENMITRQVIIKEDSSRIWNMGLELKPSEMALYTMDNGRRGYHQDKDALNGSLEKYTKVKFLTEKFMDEG